jgi:MFS transporter, ACS family, hexuronate transporter
VAVVRSAFEQDVPDASFASHLGVDGEVPALAARFDQSSARGSRVAVAARRLTRHLRWYIGGLLFLSTVVNYLDRQTLSVLGPYLKNQLHWSNANFALLIIAFRVGYTVGQAGAGRLLDRLGTRLGLTITVAFYSIVAVLTSLAGGLRSFSAFRFLLGLGESANWPGATKAVSEWFPRRESGWAVALFDSGSSVGAALAPLMVLGLFHTFGTWRPVFVIIGALGFVWLLLFRWCYRPPEDHPWISIEERREILADREASTVPVEDTTRPAISYAHLLRLRQTWGIIIGKSLTDPVWFFITDWFAVYLVARGLRLEESLLAFWVPFVAADAGNFIGGGASSLLIRCGIPVGRARKWVVAVGGIGMSCLMITLFLNSLLWLTVVFAIATCAYAAASTMLLNLPADIYWPGSVATVSGMSGAGAGLGTICATYLTGFVADHYSFAPILVGASIVPLLAVVAVLTLVRNTDATARGVVRQI